MTILDHTIFCEHAVKIEQIQPALPPVATLCEAVAKQYRLEGFHHIVHLCDRHLMEYNPKPTLMED